MVLVFLLPTAHKKYRLKIKILLSRNWIFQYTLQQTQYLFILTLQHTEIGRIFNENLVNTSIHPSIYWIVLMIFSGILLEMRFNFQYSIHAIQYHSSNFVIRFKGQKIDFIFENTFAEAVNMEKHVYLYECKFVNVRFFPSKLQVY